MNTFKNLNRMVLGCVTIAFLVCPYAFAGGDVGTVTYVEGRVDVMKENTTMAVPLREGELVFPKDIIRTKSNSKAEVTFKDKSMVRLAQNSRVEITDYQLDEQGRRKKATVNLLRGKARTIIAKMNPGTDFNILTPNSQGKINGSDVFAFFQAGVSGMLVSSGTLSVANTAYPEDAIIVPPGNSVVVPQAQIPKGPRPYLEMEKKFHEQDTNPPAETLRKRDLALIRGVVTKVFGIVKITSRGERLARDAKINEIVGTGDTIETGANGKIEIKFDNGNALNIKPDSNLVIVKLTADPKTNNYDNYFELSLGKIKATIEKLPQDSSFRVKTPTAISGVRGTIMYAEVILGMTKVFFEGGMGFITSLESGETREVGIGETAFADDNGTVSEPVGVSDEERTHITEDWEPGTGIEGYSAPEGQSGLYLYESGTDVQTIGNTGGGVVEEASDTTEGGDVIEDYSDEPQITETTPDILSGPSTPPEPQPEPQPEPTPPPEQEVNSFQGDFIGDFGYFDAEAEESLVRSGSLSAILGGTDFFWLNPASLSIIGEYDNPANHSQWYDSFFVEGETDDGAVFLGRLGGIKVNDSLEGLLYGLYIRRVGEDDYRAGYIKSTDITGNFDPATGMFEANGTLTTHLGLPTLFSPEELYGESPLHEQDGPALDQNEPELALISGDAFSGTMEVNSADITDSPGTGDQEWGIWWMAGAGTYTDSPLDDWDAVIGGKGDDPEWYDYWIGHVTGDAWSGGKFSGTTSGRSLSVIKSGLPQDGYLGTWQGELLGTYDESNWQAIGMGVYADQIEHPELPLEFDGYFEGKFGTYDPQLGYIDFSHGNVYGVFGGTESVFSGFSEFTLMGEFLGADNHSLWATDFNVGGRTNEDARFLGAMGGYKLGNTLSAGFFGLYIRNNDGVYETGYVRSSNMAGEFYPGIGMFEAEGALEYYPLSSTSYTPAQLASGEAVQMGDLRTGIKIGSDDISGQFGGSGAEIKDQNWDTILFGGGGTYQSLPSNDWDAVMGYIDHGEYAGDNSYLIWHVDGDKWSDGLLSGTISGRDMSYDAVMGHGSIIQDNGQLIGTYNEAGWQAMGSDVGTNSQSLQFGANVIGHFGQFNMGLGEMINSGSLTAVLGGINPLLPGPAPVTIMGEYNNPGGYVLWTDQDHFNGRTSDGAAFAGVMGGLNLDNALKALTLGFYIRPDGEGGYLAGYITSTDLAGNFYPEIGMFEATGTIESSLGTATIYTPDDLINDDSGAVEDSNSDDTGLISSENFSGVMDTESGNIEDQDWGLWYGSSGGSYQDLSSDGWTADVGGKSEDNDTGKIESCSLGTLTGDAWQDNEFSGTVSGTTLTDMGLQTFSGDTIGTYEGGNWQALNAGVWAETAALTSSGRFVAQGWNLPSNSTYDFAGLIGLTGPIWGENNPQFISMGEFTPPDLNNPNNPFAWAVQKEWYYPQGGLAGQDGFVSRYISQDSPLVYTYTTYNDGSGIGNGIGALYGLSAGVGGDGKLKGKAYSLYISPTGEAGALYGDIAGDYYANLGIYRLDNLGEGLIKNSHVLNIGISPVNLYNSISWDTLSGLDDHGGFGVGAVEGAIHANGGSGTMLNIGQEDWGIWNLVTGGTYEVTSGTYEWPSSGIWDVYDLTSMTTPGATSVDTSFVGGSWLGGIGSLTPAGGKWSNGEIEGTLDAIWIGLRQDGTLSGRRVNGEVVGNYIEVSGEDYDGTWQAASAGEWVEVNTLLDLTGPNDDVVALGNMASVPITEVYSSLLTGTGSFTGLGGGTISDATMNLNLYAMGPGPATLGSCDGIWAAIINGNYAGQTSNSWDLAVANGPATATLTGTQWSGGQWAATVDGRIEGISATPAIDFTGQAAGTYTGDTGGTFTGAGTGTFER